ncbi:MAG: hypothetical protein PHO27_03920 [Sulfuricurvum sp.]|nr:hypothetical protein [Sulfuricurvum sp.]
MTINGGSAAAIPLQSYTSSSVQSQSSASGMAPSNTNKKSGIDTAEFSEAAQALAQNANTSSTTDTSSAKMQSALMQRILSAYASNTPTSNSALAMA